MCMGMRAQPCDAPTSGTLGLPWMAYAGQKYTELYMAPSGPFSQPSIFMIAVKSPMGVTASPHTPFSQNGIWEPEETCVTTTGAPSLYSTSSLRLTLTSTRLGGPSGRIGWIFLG